MKKPIEPIEEPMKRGPDPEEYTVMHGGGLCGDRNAPTGRDVPKVEEEDGA